MNKKLLIGGMCFGILLFITFVNVFLPKDFSGYYKDIDMVREELSDIYDNGELVYTQKSQSNRHLDFIVSDDIHIIGIKEKNTLFGSRYRMILKGETPNLGEILERKVKEFNETGSVSFTPVGWLVEWPWEKEEKVFWSVLPAECMLNDLESGVTAHPFTYNGEEYVLYVKVE